MAKNFLLKFEVSEQIRSIEWYKFRIRDIKRTIFLPFNAIFCYSFILNYVFYNSQLLFVEAIIHLRKTICHIPNLRNINDSSHPKYVSEMKKKFSLSILCALFIFHWKFTAYVCTEYIPPQIGKEKGPSIQGFFEFYYLCKFGHKLVVLEIV